MITGSLSRQNATDLVTSISSSAIVVRIVTSHCLTLDRLASNCRTGVVIKRLPGMSYFMFIKASQF